MAFRLLITKVLRYNKKTDVALLSKSYAFAKKILSHYRRESGREELKHNLEVASLLADIKADDVTIAAGLLHNLLDKGISLSVIKDRFGGDIVSILKVTKKGGVVDTNKYSDASAFRKMLMASIHDPRVLLIKIANKISGLRDLYGMKDGQRRKDIAQEALNIYAPIAHKLGLGTFKEELEDLAFEMLEPKIYSQIVNTLKEGKEDRSITLHKTKRMLMLELSREGIVAEVQGRTKHIYSIYKKILTRNYTLGAMRDLVGVRIITGSLEDCYNVLRIIHSRWVPVPNTFKDYIAMPKPNGYQSLHVVVLGPDNKEVEFQIRTKEMHEFAEEGAAAHSSYKGIKDAKAFDKKLYWLREALEDLSKEKTIDTRTVNLFEEKIYVLTPKRDVVELPKGSTVLDFAYSVHTSLGHSAVGAYVNDKYVTLKTEVKNGDSVRIMTQKNHKPSIDWLNLVKTNRARDKIRNYLKKVGKVVHGNSVFDEGVAIGFLIDHDKKKGLSVIQHPKCCPLPKDDIMLEFDVNKHLLVLHRADCLKGVPKNSQLKCSWKKFMNKEILFEIHALDRVGLFSDILHVFSKLGINLETTKAETSGSVAVCYARAKIKDLSELANITRSLREMPDIRNITLREI